MRERRVEREPLRVCLDARMREVQSGAFSVVIALASAFSRMTDGDEEYLFLTNGEPLAELRPFLRGPCRALAPVMTPGKAAKSPLRKIPGLRTAYRRLRPARAPELPISDGTVEKSGADLMHFTLQGAFLTSVPSIYQPHDLQHIHLPQFWPEKELRMRAVRYPTFCERARLVVAMTEWGKCDLVKQFGLSSEKVCVIPWAPMLPVYSSPTDEETREIVERLGLEEPYLFFPAHIMEHKNHLGLLRALAQLRDQGECVRLVCCGREFDFFRTIEKEVRALALEAQVRFLGYVDEKELQVLYGRCRAMIFPSKFEGWGLPLTEAFASGVPVGCSRIQPLIELASGAALLFDPDRTEEIADAAHRLWNGADLRRQLGQLGRKRGEQFSWDRTARMFRAQYRRVVGRSITEEDRHLLDTPALV